MKIVKIIAALILMVSLGAQRANAQAHSLWYEYGDGNFVTQSFTEQSELNSFVVANLTTTGSGKFGYQKITKHYDPPPPPQNIFACRLSNGSSVGKVKTTPVAGTQLQIFTSTNDFITQDTVQFALYYKKPNNSNITKVAFFYNSTTNQTFIPVGNPTTDIIRMPEVTSSANMSINQVRTHNAENSSVASSTLLNKVNTAKGVNYQDGLVFTFSSSSTAEKNIFVTMFTNSVIDLNEDESFKLVFLDSNDNVINDADANLINHKDLPSHDPNYEKVQPGCLVYPTDAGKILHYKVHFQNTGLGPARNIVTTTTLPIGYTISDITNFTSMEWYIGKRLRNAGYTLDNSSSMGNLLILKFVKLGSVDSILNGTLGMSDPLNNITTMGDFNFDIRVKSPLVGPMDLNSSTAIVFDRNEPVITNTAVVRVRKCCTCKEKSNSNTNKPCKKCKQSKFINWLFCKDC